MTTFSPHQDNSQAQTAVNCEEIGHCWHPGTIAGSLWCCRCGMYSYKGYAVFYVAFPCEIAMAKKEEVSNDK